MKKIKNLKINAYAFELINNDLRSPRQLYRLNDEDQYSIVLLDRPNRVFSFESKALAEVLNDLGGGVEDVTLVEFNEPERGGDEGEAFEIRLHLNGNVFVAINQNDEVRRCDLLGYDGLLSDASAKPVSALWDCQGDFEFLWITDELAKSIEPYVSKSNAVEILRWIWSDCQRVIHECEIEPEVPTNVCSEFIDLIMTRYPDRTVLRPAI